jgi:hypothetical protein
VCQRCPSGARLVFACASPDVISIYLSIINRLWKTTYKKDFHLSNP